MYRAPRFSLPAVSQGVLPGLGDAEKIRLWSAIPFGYRRARRATWRRHLEQHPAIAALRADGLRNLMAVLWVLAIHADDRTGRTRPTWQRIIDGTGLSRSTVSTWLRWAREHDLIGHVEHGSTERFRAGQDPDQVGNRAAVYVLLIPEPVSRTPSGLRPLVLNPSRARGPVEPDEPDKPAAQGAAGGSYDDLAKVKTQRQRLAAAEELQRRVPVARCLSAPHLRSLTREFFVADWCVRDVHHALDHAPDGAEHQFVGVVRYPPGWIAARLGLWRDDAGQPVPSKRQRRVAEVAAERAATVQPMPRKSEFVPAPSVPAAPGLANVLSDREKRAHVRAERDLAERARVEAWQPEPVAPDPRNREAVRQAAIRRARYDKAQRRREASPTASAPGVGSGGHSRGTPAGTAATPS